MGMMASIGKILILALIMALALPESAMAYALKDSADAVIKSLHHVPTIVSGIAYLHGGVTVFAGANKLKAHAEDPAKTPMVQGLSRIMLGSMIASLPPFMNWIQSSLYVAGSDLHFTRMGMVR